MRRTLALAAVVGALAVPTLAAADQASVPGCASYAGQAGGDVTVGPVTVHVSVVADSIVCAFDAATVTADTDPIEESNNCAYGPAIEVGGPSAQVTRPRVEATATVDGRPVGGTLYQGSGVGVAGPGYDSGPLWTIPC